MARVGDEAPLAREPGLEPREHLVQRAGEAGDLVVGGRDGQTSAGRRRGDLLRLSAHRLDGPQRRGRERVAQKRSEQEGDRAADQQLVPQPFERLVAVAERGADDHDLLAGRRPEQPESLLVEAGDPASLDHDRGLAGPGELVGREERGALERRRGVDHLAVGPDHLRDVLVRLGQGPRLAERGAAALGLRRQVGGPRAQGRVDLLVERVREPPVKEEARRREQHGHREREGERQAQAEREAAHASSSRRR